MEKRNMENFSVFFFAFAIIVQKHSPKKNSQLAVPAIGPNIPGRKALSWQKTWRFRCYKCYISFREGKLFFQPRLCSFFLSFSVPLYLQLPRLSFCRKHAGRPDGMETVGWIFPEKRRTIEISPHFFKRDTIGSMYGIFTFIYHKNQPNVGEYTIHGSYGDTKRMEVHTMESSSAITRIGAMRSQVEGAKF